MTQPQLVLLLVTLLLSAFFSGIEIAFVSASKLHFELKNKKGEFTGKILSSFFQHPSRFITTTLVGNTLALVVYGIVMASILEPILQKNLPDVLSESAAFILLIQTLLSTLLVLITAEFTPKSFFMLNPNRMLSLTALPFVIMYYVLLPFVFIISRISKFLIIYVLKVEYSEEKPVFGLTDLNEYIKTTLIGKDEQEATDVNTLIFNNALDFKTVKVRDCLIPRTEITAVEVNDSIKELKKAFIKSGHSKIIVYKESIDDVVGYVHSLELFKKPKKITSILTEIPIIPETMQANEVLIQLLNERKSLALVVDEFGGTSGVLSVEDIIEEILGDIQDEHDEEKLVDTQLDEYNFIFSARHEIDFINEKYGLNIPDGEYDTLGGYILNVNENLPTMNEVIEADGFLFEIVSVVNNRIVQVKLTITPPDN
ncbi:MAG: hemolysin family protein [Bacteroidota bacterium]